MTNGPHIDNHNNDEVPRPMKVNVVRVLEDRDFNYVKRICDHHADWEMVYEKKKTRVWTKLVADSDFQMIKLRAEFPDVPASIAYDVLHDTEYRHKWDKYTHRSQDIGLINPNTDICYYALSSMPPFTSRDFVLQRSWLDLGNEKYIIGHSVCHEDFPPIKGYIRGTVFLTAYFIRMLNDHGCQITYVTHSDPKGKLPMWLVNRITKTVAPKLSRKLHKVCLKYPHWKSEHAPHWKPWLFPEQQINFRRINISECQPRDYDQPIIDETKVSSKDFKGILEGDDEDND